MRIVCGALGEWLEKKATVVMPSRFLAGAAIEQYGRERLRNGIETWERPAVYGIDAWLHSCWEQARYTLPDVPTLLSDAQERALWHNIIEREHPNLFDISATVRLAREAAATIAEWHIPAEGELWAEHSDALQFQRWYRLFRRQCHENRWVTRADLKRLLAGWLSSNEWRPSLTVFIGFETVSPSLDSVWSALGPLGVRVPFDSNAKAAKKVMAKELSAFAEEVDFAARRLRFLFEEKTDRSLALFVPSLRDQHQVVARALDSVFFSSTAARISRAETAEAFIRIANSNMLSDEPLVAAALLLLNLASERIDQTDASAILRCPFVGGAQAEKNARALADINLRKRRELDATFADLVSVSRGCPILNESWRKLSRLLPEFFRKKTFAGWSESISEMLTTLGWPGDAELTPREDRVVEQWKAQLSALSSLGLVSGPVTFEGATAQLRRLLAQRSERGDWNSPIQVLDADQAGGIEFDAAIVVGLSEEVWPSPVRLSPLIPFRLLKQHSLPGVTPESIREDRLRKTQALFSSAPEVAVTFSKELATVARPFVAKRGKAPQVWEGQSPWEAFALQALEQVADGMAPPYVAKTEEARGGTGIIKAQSQCPFQAFAKYRLHARRPEDASFGFDALERGTFVHKSLENVWRRLESLQNLKRMPGEELRQVVQAAIADAVAMKDLGPLHQLSVSAERERLEEVILDWLEVERGRQQDFTVETIEESRRFEVPGLSLQLRVDRIDRLSNGNLVLIDYKSGKQSRPKLEKDRPAEPQLLVYAAAAGAPVDGLFFGQLKPREVKAVGFSRTKQFQGSAVAVKKDWDDYLEGSRETVERLAGEYVQGVAEVRPTNAPCEFCGLKAFCRVNEQGAAGEEEE